MQTVVTDIWLLRGKLDTARAQGPLLASGTVDGAFAAVDIVLDHNRAYVSCDQAEGRTF